MNTGGPAFPQHGWSKDPETIARMSENGGMTLRDYFAGQALIGLFADGCVMAIGEESWGENGARQAYELADAMLFEREK